jgi:hypothetical protein
MTTHSLKKSLTLIQLVTMWAIPASGPAPVAKKGKAAASSFLKAPDNGAFQLKVAK